MEEGAFQFVTELEKRRVPGREFVADWGLYHGFHWIPPINCRMTVVFYDESGRELDRAELQNAEAWER